MFKKSIIYILAIMISCQSFLAFAGDISIHLWGTVEVDFKYLAYDADQLKNDKGHFPSSLEMEGHHSCCHCHAFISDISAVAAYHCQNVEKLFEKTSIYYSNNTFPDIRPPIFS